MKFKTFEALLNNCISLYDNATKRDRKISDAIGGDTEVMSDWWDENLVSILDTIALDMGDTTETIDWLFWESMLNRDSYMDFVIDDITYEGSPRNVWLDLKGRLDERYSKPNSKPINKKSPNVSIKEVDMTHIAGTEFDWNDMSTHYAEMPIKEYREKYSEVRGRMAKSFGDAILEFMFDVNDINTLNAILRQFEKICYDYAKSDEIKSYNLAINGSKIDISIKYDNTELSDEVFLAMSEDTVELGEY